MQNTIPNQLGTALSTPAACVCFRAQEAEFKKVQSAHSGSKDAMVQKVDQETASRLKAMESDVATHREKIIARILNMVYEIQPKMHQNARFEEQPEEEPQEQHHGWQERLQRHEEPEEQEEEEEEEEKEDEE